MTKKDYIIIAKVINASRATWSIDTAPLAITAIEDVAQALAGALAGDNPHFDREKFLTACIK